MKEREIRVYYDYNCPYCRIAQSLVDKFRSETSFLPVWRPYALLPGIPEEGIPWELTSLEMERFKASVERLAKKWEMSIKIPAFRPRTELALQASEFALEAGLFDGFHRNMFDAYWLEGKNIGRPNVVMEVGEATGLRSSELEYHLRTGTFRKNLENARKEMLGLPYVALPTFVIGPYRIYGIKDYQVFRRAISLLIQQETSGKSL